MAVDYSARVYRCLMKRKLIFGIPLVPLITVIFITALIFIAAESIIVLPFSFILLLIMKEITKKDEYLLECFLESILEPDYL